MPVFNVEKLKEFVKLTFLKQAKRALPPNPEFVDGEPEFEVKEVLAEQEYHGQPQFLIHWKGYLLEEDT